MLDYFTMEQGCQCRWSIALTSERVISLVLHHSKYLFDNANISHAFELNGLVLQFGIRNLTTEGKMYMHKNRFTHL